MKVNTDRSKCAKNRSTEETLAKNQLISGPFANTKLRLNGLEILSSLPIFFYLKKPTLILLKIKRRI